MQINRQLTALEVLKLSLAEQIEAAILQSPECSRTASLQVDRYLLCSETIANSSVADVGTQ